MHAFLVGLKAGTSIGRRWDFWFETGPILEVSGRPPRVPRSFRGRDRRRVAIASRKLDFGGLPASPFAHGSSGYILGFGFPGFWRSDVFAAGVPPFGCGSDRENKRTASHFKIKEADRAVSVQGDALIQIWLWTLGRKGFA